MNNALLRSLLAAAKTLQVNCDPGGSIDAAVHPDPERANSKLPPKLRSLSAPAKTPSALASTRDPSLDTAYALATSWPSLNAGETISYARQSGR
jgi:hypothetical protein